jgi:ribonuclease BN (tRNA processing enzyme)
MAGGRYLLVTWDGGGVLPPELGVARRLIARGHSVRMLADPTAAAEARAVRRRHRPAHGARAGGSAAYRVRTPDGAVVVSGDTRVCAEVEQLATGADLLVHEACPATPLAPLIAGTRLTAATRARSRSVATS